MTERLHGDVPGVLIHSSLAYCRGMQSAQTTTDRVELRPQIAGAGLRVTQLRLAVMAALTDRPHSGADAVFHAVERELRSTSLQAVYGVLGALTAAGLLRRIQPVGLPALYERRTGDNHHHGVCGDCMAIQDVDCREGAGPCHLPEKHEGFTVQSTDVTYWGLCGRCSAARP